MRQGVCETTGSGTARPKGVGPLPSPKRQRGGFQPVGSAGGFQPVACAPGSDHCAAKTPHLWDRLRLWDRLSSRSNDRLESLSHIPGWHAQAEGAGMCASQVVSRGGTALGHGTRALVMALLMLGVSATSTAAQYEVTWYTVDSGGTMDASGGGYTAGGTIGQHDAGTMAGGGYAVLGGFWVFRPAGGAANPPGLPSEPTHQAKKNRYITIDASTNSTNTVAYQVTLTSMKRCTGDDRRACIVDTDCPGVCTGNHDLQCADNTICINAGAGTCMPTGPCVEHGDVGSVAKYVDTPVTNTCVPLADCATQWFAQLSDTAVYRVWTEDALHITDCQIVPVATFDVRATADGITFSEPLTIWTVEKPQVHYADCVGPQAGGAFTPPDGYVNVLDVQAYILAIQGRPTAPHTTWVDLHSTSMPVVPQQILNIGDLQTIKFGFQGKTYVETPGHENPADCP